MTPPSRLSSFFFFNDTATTEIYTLSLHDALPISPRNRQSPRGSRRVLPGSAARQGSSPTVNPQRGGTRSEEHTSELQSHLNLVCRLLLEKKKKTRMKKQRTSTTEASSGISYAALL